MIWPFSILFGPIQKEIVETYSLKKKPNWKALTPLLVEDFSIAGNTLPSKNTALPVGKIFFSTAQVNEQSMRSNSKLLQIVSDIRSIFNPKAMNKKVRHTEQNGPGCEFTMDYKNMFIVIPTVIMYEHGNDIIVKYFYKQGVKSLQYYWFGFTSVMLLFIVFSFGIDLVGFMLLETALILQ